MVKAEWTGEFPSLCSGVVFDKINQCDWRHGSCGGCI